MQLWFIYLLPINYVNGLRWILVQEHWSMTRYGLSKFSKHDVWIWSCWWPSQSKTRKKSIIPKHAWSSKRAPESWLAAPLSLSWNYSGQCDFVFSLCGLGSPRPRWLKAGSTCFRIWISLHLGWCWGPNSEVPQRAQYYYSQGVDVLLQREDAACSCRWHWIA